MVSKEKFPFVTVVVINYNGGKYVLNCIQSLLKTDYINYKVVVIDNASKDSSADEIRYKFPNLQIIKLDTNIGYARGANYAMELFKDKYIVVLNNDIYVERDWLRILIETAEKYPNAIMIGPRIIDSIDRKTSFLQSYLTFPLIGSSIVCFKRSEKNYSEIVESAYAPGAIFLLRRYEALSIGGFDSDYFLNWEEIDFAWRAWLCGYRVLMNLNAYVYHNGGRSTKTTLTRRKMSFLNQKNRIMTYHKYLSNRLLLIGLIGEMVLGGLILARSMRNDVDARIKLQGYFLAIFWILKNFKLVYRKRLNMKRVCKYWGALPTHTRASKVRLVNVSKYLMINSFLKEVLQ
jgi:hypothetical protein